jgi:hypothetical protein
MCGPEGLPKAQNYLYRNNGDGTFTDVSKESGVAGFRGSYGLTAISIDADEDGWPDIFVACDMTPSLLLMNNRDGTFREEGLFRGIALSGDGRQMGGMGVCAGDYNLEGHTDLLKTHFYNQATGLYRNDGHGNFDDVTIQAGLNKEPRFVGFGAGLVDFDNDGYPDILVTTGSVYPEVARVSSRFPARSPRLLFRNQGDGTFVQLGADAGPDINARHCSRGAAFGDFDNDGDMDVLIMNVNEPPMFAFVRTPEDAGCSSDHSPDPLKERLLIVVNKAPQSKILELPAEETSLAGCTEFEAAAQATGTAPVVRGGTLHVEEPAESMTVFEVR